MYAEIINGQIEKIVRKGTPYKNTAFGVNAPDEAYFEVGLYKLFDEIPIVDKYHTEGSNIVVIDETAKTATRTKEVIPMTLEQVKTRMLDDLSKTFSMLSTRPVVQTSLGYPVDGGRSDLDNFKNGKDINFPIIKDANNNVHTATITDYDIIILAIQENGANLINTNWTKKSEIASLATIEDCILYEATPYDDNGITKYKNNITEW